MSGSNTTMEVMGADAKSSSSSSSSRSRTNNSKTDSWFNKNVSYYYDDDIGNFYYGRG
jgi:hypothetical protein